MKNKQPLDDNQEFILGFIANLVPRITWIIFIIPALLIPAAFYIYFTEGKNIAQFFSIIAFSIALPYVLWLMLRYSMKISVNRIAEEKNKDKK